MARAGGVAGASIADDDSAMEVIKGCVADVASWTLWSLWYAAGALLAMTLVMAWCLLVFVLTGRLPWFVRKYF